MNEYSFVDSVAPAEFQLHAAEIQVLSNHHVHRSGSVTCTARICLFSFAFAVYAGCCRALELVEIAVVQQVSVWAVPAGCRLRWTISLYIYEQVQISNNVR